MSEAELLREARARGVQFTAREGRIDARAPAGTLTPELKAAIVAHKPTLLRLLESEQRFGHEVAAWYPWIGLAVQTPDGPGTLLQAFTSGLRVLLDSDPDGVRSYPREQVSAL